MLARQHWRKQSEKNTCFIHFTLRRNNQRAERDKSGPAGQTSEISAGLWSPNASPHAPRTSAAREGAELVPWPGTAMLSPSMEKPS